MQPVSIPTNETYERSDSTPCPPLRPSLAHNRHNKHSDLWLTNVFFLLKYAFNSSKNGIKNYFELHSIDIVNSINFVYLGGNQHIWERGNVVMMKSINFLLIFCGGFADFATRSVLIPGIFWGNVHSERTGEFPQKIPGFWTLIGRWYTVGCKFVGIARQPMTAVSKKTPVILAVDRSLCSSDCWL